MRIMIIDAIKDALRGLRRAPLLSASAVLCLALGSAATTALATLVDASLLRQLPFPEPERLVRVWLAEPGGSSASRSRCPKAASWRRSARSIVSSPRPGRAWSPGSATEPSGSAERR
jgi:hypothetical protein